MPKQPKIVVVGSLAFDDIATPAAARKRVLGGSAAYACAAASFFSRPGMVAVAGSDFTRRHASRLDRFGIDLRGLAFERGKTFHWSGVYERDFNRRRTIFTRLNVFENFMPRLPAPFRKSPFVFLANIAPVLQSHVMCQVENPAFVVADTMDLWIKTARPALLALLGKVDLLLLNDSEAGELSGANNPVAAARRILKLGPRYLIIKKGEHGSMLFFRDGLFMLPAFPVEKVFDPTGAGDTFAGGLIGALAATPGLSARALRAGAQEAALALRRAMVTATVTASFAVESFGFSRLEKIAPADIARRRAIFARMARFS